jgi:hypothetical protein
MESYADSNKLYKELSNFHETIQDCIGVLESKNSYIGMSLEELSKLYDKIDNGLISYNIIIQNNSGLFKEIAELSKQNDKPGKFLEAQLLNVVISMVAKDPSHILPQKFKESLWNEKMKDKEYYNKICDIAPIFPEHRSTLYSFLQR